MQVRKDLHFGIYDLKVTKTIESTTKIGPWASWWVGVFTKLNL